MYLNKVLVFIAQTFIVYIFSTPRSNTSRPQATLTCRELILKIIRHCFEGYVFDKKSSNKI